MDHWLDSLARATAGGLTRREALRRLGGGLAVLVIGTQLPRPAHAQSGCPSGQADCNGSCKDLDTDRKNCGECGLRCGRNFHCTLGTCLCDAGFCISNGTCVRPTRDPENCGTCGNVCPTVPNATPTCRNGQCGFACQPGFGNCNGNATDGCEADLRTDDNNCGRCGRACSANESCIRGRCNRARCDDGVPNGQETDKDCGGPTCPKCADGRKCDINRDCQSGLCNPVSKTCITCDDNHPCPSGQCCSSGLGGGSCLARCPSGKCCANFGGGVAPFCALTQDCPNDGCCDSTGTCVTGRSDTECGNGGVCFSCAQSQLGHVCRNNGTCGCGSDSECNTGLRCDPVLRICAACSPNLPCPGSQCCETTSLNSQCVDSCLIGFCCSNGACVNNCPSGQCCPVGGGPCVVTCPNNECCDGGNCVSTCQAGRFCVNNVCIQCDSTHPCPTDKVCEDGFCVDCANGSRPGTAGDGVCCAVGTTPCGSSCCPSPQVCFNSACCTPTTCAAQGKNCGSISDGCGGTLSCGTCPSGQTCTSNVCGSGCDANNPCPSGQCCLNGACGSCPDGACCASGDGDAFCCNASSPVCCVGTALGRNDLKSCCDAGSSCCEVGNCCPAGQVCCCNDDGFSAGCSCCLTSQVCCPHDDVLGNFTVSCCNASEVCGSDGCRPGG